MSGVPSSFSHLWRGHPLSPLPGPVSLTHQQCPHLTDHLPKEKSGICPQLLGYDLQALGMSCLIRTSLFTWWSWAARQYMLTPFRMGLWVMRYQPDLWRGWRPRSACGWSIMSTRPRPNKNSDTKAQVRFPAWQHSVCTVAWSSWHCPQPHGERSAGSPTPRTFLDSARESLSLADFNLHLLPVINHNHEYKAFSVLWVLLMNYGT